MIRIKILLIILLLAFIGCQDYNSNTFDATLYGPTDLVGGPDFIQAYPVLQKRCMNCHYHSDWSAYKDENDWIDADLVLPGDSAGSILIRRIINTNLAISDMPEGGSRLPDTEYDLLLDWIDNL